MPYAYVGSTNPGSGSGDTYTIVRTFTAGNFGALAVKMESENRSVASVRDDHGQTWSLLAGVSANGFRLEAWRCPNQVGGATTVTVVFDTATVSNVLLDLDEYAGVALVSPVDGTPEAGSTFGATLTPTAVTTSNATDLVWSFGYSFNTSRALGTPAGYATRVSINTNTFATADERQTSAGSASVTWTVSGGNAEMAAIIAAFKESGGGGGTAGRLVGGTLCGGVLVSGLLTGI